MREIAPLHEEHWFEIYGKIALTGEPARFEHQAAQLGRWYDVYALRVGEPKERQVAILFKDITERKRTEEAIKTSNEQLQAANKELEAFSYSVSHDLRAPLRSIDGFSQALLEDCAATLSPEGAVHLQRIRRASQHMAQLIDDLLNLSRITRSELQRVPVDLSALSQGIMDGLREPSPTTSRRRRDYPGVGCNRGCASPTCGAGESARQRVEVYAEAAPRADRVRSHGP